MGRGWAQKGQRLRVPTTSQHRARLNLFGWVAPLSGKKGLIRAVQGNTDGFLAVLQHIWKKFPGYDIQLYVDRAPWHKGERVRLFLESHTVIHLEYLPPYQPALNPQERIWRQGRYEVTKNTWFYDLDTIYAKFQFRICHWSANKIKTLCAI